MYSRVKKIGQMVVPELGGPWPGAIFAASRIVHYKYSLDQGKRRHEIAGARFFAIGLGYDEHPRGALGIRQCFPIKNRRFSQRFEFATCSCSNECGLGPWAGTFFCTRPSKPLKYMLFKK